MQSLSPFWSSFYIILLLFAMQLLEMLAILVFFLLLDLQLWVFLTIRNIMWLMLMYSKMTDVTEKYRNCRLCIFTSSEPWMVDHCVSVCVRTEYFVVIVMHILFYTVFVILWAHYMNCVLLVIYWQLNYTAAVAAVIILKCWWMFELGWLGYLI